MELFHANRQWATRPDDERFTSLADMLTVTKHYADAAREKVLPWADLRVEASGDDLVLMGKAGVPATFTHYAFGQLATRIGAPANYLRALPPTLAAQNVNYGLKNKVMGSDGASSPNASLLFHSNGGLVLRAATTDHYARVWNHEVVSRLIDLADRFNLEPARPTFNYSGDRADQAPSLYASDHDMFAFLMSKEREVTDPTGNSLFRGLIAANSEVGDRALTLLRFWFREVCGNHIIWGAEKVAEIKLAHKGNIRERFAQATLRVRHYLDGAGSMDEAAFTEMNRPIAGNMDDVLDVLFGRKVGTKKLLASAAAAIIPDTDGDPLSKWGFAQGMTRYSQTLPYADARTEVDQAAGRLLSLTF